MYLGIEKNYTENPDLNMFKTHAHEHYEIFCFISGNARYYVEGNIYDLKPEDILIIKKAEVHSLLINKAVPYTRFTVHFSRDALLYDSPELFDLLNQKPLGQLNRIHGNAAEKSRWIYYLEKAVATKSQNRQRLFLTLLFDELLEKLKQHKDIPANSTSDRVIEYINQNLMQIKNLDEVCDKFFVSKTHLNRRFKAITGSTVWDYIIAKRLLSAKEMLNNGQAPTLVCEICGYSEYSAFYRAYKQRFNTSPKDDYIKKEP